MIRARTGEGRERAKAKGVKMGRKPKLTDHQKREAIRRRDHGDETLAEMADPTTCPAGRFQACIMSSIYGSQGPGAIAKVPPELS